MNIRDLSFLADENIDKEIVSFLRTEGFDVFDIKEECLFQLSDAAILELSYSKKRIVLSQDSEFGKLMFRDGANFHEIIYLRPGHYSPILHLKTMKTIIDSYFDFIIPFILVAENTEAIVRIRLRIL